MTKTTPKKKTPRKRKPKVEKVELKKVAVICAPGLDNHLAEVSDYIKANFEAKICVTNSLDTIFEAIAWADIIWIEWANQTAVAITGYGHLMYRKQVILRLHSYEAFDFGTLRNIQWAYITDLVFVADHIKRYVMEQIPAIEHNVDRIHLIPNGIDTVRFDIPKNKPTKVQEVVHTAQLKRIAYLGQINFKKGPQLMIRAFAELVRCDPEFTLHIGGVFQEPRYIEYLNQMKEQNPLLADRIIFHGWQEDPAKFLADKSHIICTSLLESQYKAVMEGMAMGLKPLIHNFVGAKEIYPVGLIWDDIYEFVNQAMSPSNEPKVYRDFVVKNFNTVDTVKKIGALFEAHPEPAIALKPESERKPIKLSAAIIMRDEESNLDRCLASVKDICDEIIVVDNGSKERPKGDRSLKILKKYGAKVFDHYCKKEDFHFAEYRNLSIDYATGDWLILIDCDQELFGDKVGLKEFLSSVGDDYNAVSVCIKNAIEGKGTQVNEAKVFRNGFVKYRRAWHNVPIVEGMETHGVLMFSDINLLHHGDLNTLTKEEAKTKMVRTKILLEKALEEDPEDYELFFYMLQVYGTEEKWQAAANCGEKYISHRHELNSFQLAVYYSLIRIYAVRLKNIDRAVQLLDEAKILLPQDLDISFVECELGVMTNNGRMLLNGARRFVDMYKIFKERPDAKGGRFVFNMQPTSLLFCLKHMTSYLMTDGIQCLKLLQGSITEFPEGEKVEAEKEIAAILEPLNIDTK